MRIVALILVLLGCAPVPCFAESTPAVVSSAFAAVDYAATDAGSWYIPAPDSECEGCAEAPRWLKLLFLGIGVCTVMLVLR